MCADMKRLRQALAVLLTNTSSLADRIDRAVTLADGMGKAVATAILLVVYPERFGVWNMTSEAGLKALNLWPTFTRGDSLGKRYEKLNAILVQLSLDLDVDLWTLDSLWWRAMNHENGEKGGVLATSSRGTEEAVQGFPAERHPHDSLSDNLDQISTLNVGTAVPASTVQAQSKSSVESLRRISTVDIEKRVPEQPKQRLPMNFVPEQQADEVIEDREQQPEPEYQEVSPGTRLIFSQTSDPSVKDLCGGNLIMSEFIEKNG
jgi:hypothetical protein